MTQELVDSVEVSHELYCEDCIEGCRERIGDGSVDLIITDPPYGIDGTTLHKHYHRKEEFVLDGYIEVPNEEYFEFTQQWIQEAERILRPGGTLYVLSGYTHLIDILNALRETSLVERNHLIWKYNFGVHTKKKYVSSHYHILYYVKPGGEPTFNTYCRYGPQERKDNGGSLNYEDREDVWTIKKEYKQGQTKNKNELPNALLQKLIQYSSDEGNVVCDLFLGGFSTAKVALGLNRKAIGFELSKPAFDYRIKEMEGISPGELLPTLRQPEMENPVNQGKKWTESEKDILLERFRGLMGAGSSKKAAIYTLMGEFGRGYFSVFNVIEGSTKKSE